MTERPLKPLNVRLFALSKYPCFSLLAAQVGLDQEFSLQVFVAIEDGIVKVLHSLLEISLFERKVAYVVMTDPCSQVILIFVKYITGFGQVYNRHTIRFVHEIIG
jgi:hypothetical protein